MTIDTYIRWHRDDKRYYEIRLRKDLFGEWRVTRVWGRRDSPAGGTADTVVSNLEEGQVIIDGIARRRRQHRYHVVVKQE